MKQEQAPTLSLYIEDLVRDAIVSGSIAPGAPLRPGELAKRWEVSPGVVREALTRLSENGLVTALHNHGFQVRSLSLKGLSDLMSVRQLAETEALRLSVIAGDLEWEAGLVGSFHRLSSISMQAAHDDTDERQNWMSAHRAFHDKLYEACGNEVLLKICRSLGDAAEFYRRWAVTANDPRERDIPGEHRQLLDAVLKRDQDLAVVSLLRHLGLTEDHIRHEIERPTDDQPAE